MAPTASGTDTLKAVYGAQFAVGVAIPSAQLDAAERQLLLTQFTNITTEACLIATHIRPEEGRFDFTIPDALVEMARSHDLIVNGHTLVWHSRCPDWFFKDQDKPASRELVLKRMREHIAGVVGHYAGKMASWDVVNEAVGDGKDYLRPSPLLTTMGEDFIAEAFLAAHQADPQAELCYNDYNIEVPSKREKTLRLMRDLQQRKIPVSAIGIQGHYRLNAVPYQDIEDAILAYHALGLKVMFTELDIDMVQRHTTGGDANLHEQGSNDPYAQGLPPEMQQRLAAQYAKLFALFAKHHDKISRVTFWGLHDGRSWLNHWPRLRTNHPLLWDRAMQPKPAFQAVIAAAGQARDAGKNGP